MGQGEELKTALVARGGISFEDTGVALFPDKG